MESNNNFHASDEDEKNTGQQNTNQQGNPIQQQKMTQQQKPMYQQKQKKGQFAWILVLAFLAIGTVVLAFNYNNIIDYFTKDDTSDSSLSKGTGNYEGVNDGPKSNPSESSESGDSSESGMTTDTTTELADSETEVDIDDAESYFSNYSKVLSVEKADEAAGVHTEETSTKELEKRGFDEYEILTHYSMNGDYYDEDEVISDSSSDKHPMYETYYYNSSGELWKIMLIDDEIVANPISYNLQFKQSTSVVISESEHVMSYDCYSNSFYKTIPEKSELLVITEETIDTKILDNYTFEKIDKIFEDENKNSNEQTTE